MTKHPADQFGFNDQSLAEYRAYGQRSHLAQDDWHYVDKPDLNSFSREDWLLLDLQRKPYLQTQKAKQALDMLKAQKDMPTFGYEINNYEHCLQAATLAMHAGEDEETIVVALFHDLGFITCNESHGEFAAQFLRPYISERNFWMLERHMYFQSVHCTSHPQCNEKIRERWRGHPYFEYTAHWVDRYDQTSIIANFENAPLSAFEPMVYRLFDRPPQALPLPE